MVNNCPTLVYFAVCMTASLDASIEFTFFTTIRGCLLSQFIDLLQYFVLPFHYQLTISTFFIIRWQQYSWMLLQNFFKGDNNNLLIGSSFISRLFSGLSGP